MCSRRPTKPPMTGSTRKSTTGRRRTKGLPFWFLSAEVLASSLTIIGLVIGVPEGAYFLGAGGFVGSNAGVVLSWIRSEEDR